MNALTRKTKSLLGELSEKPLDQVLQIWSLLPLFEEGNQEEIPMVRGWLMDELESRNQEAFDAWIDSCEDSPERFFNMSPEELRDLRVEKRINALCPCIDKFRGIEMKCQHPNIEDCGECEIFQEVVPEGRR